MSGEKEQGAYIASPSVTAVEQKLDEKLSKLRQTQEPEHRRKLLAEMKLLIAELEHMMR